MDFGNLFEFIKDKFGWLLGNGGLVLKMIEIIRALFNKSKTSNSSEEHKMVHQTITAGKNSTNLQINGDVNIGGSDDRRKENK